VTPLERELVDLGEHLAHGDGARLAGAVERRLAQRSPVPAWARVAAAVVLAVAAVVALPPSRRTIARWLGIGTVAIRSVPATVLPPTVTNPAGSTVPGSLPGAGPTTNRTPSAAIVAAQARVPFTIRVVGLAEAGEPIEITVDDTGPGQGVAVAIRYATFTLVELSSGDGDFPIAGKLVPPGATVSFTDVGSTAAAWVDGVHEIAYLAPDGSVRTDTVRRAGPVLVWARDRVTYRLEGLDDRAEAVRVAASLRSRNHVPPCGARPTGRCAHRRRGRRRRRTCGGRARRTARRPVRSPGRS
jgi:hypothetical protein